MGCELHTPSSRLVRAADTSQPHPSPLVGARLLPYPTSSLSFAVSVEMPKHHGSLFLALLCFFFFSTTGAKNRERHTPRIRSCCIDDGTTHRLFQESCTCPGLGCQEDKQKGVPLVEQHGSKFPFVEPPDPSGGVSERSLVVLLGVLISTRRKIFDMQPSRDPCH